MAQQGPDARLLREGLGQGAGRVLSVGVQDLQGDVLSDAVPFLFDGALLLGGYFIFRNPPPPRTNGGDPSGLNFGR